MPIYKITQKQGNRVFTSQLEAKNLSSLQNFLKSVSTAKVTCIYEVLFEDDSFAPIDDFNYFKQFKAIAKNNSSASRQVLIHNVKPTLTTDEIFALIKANLEVGGLAIKSLCCSLFYKG